MASPFGLREGTCSDLWKQPGSRHSSIHHSRYKDPWLSCNCTGLWLDLLLPTPGWRVDGIFVTSQSVSEDRSRQREHLSGKSRNCHAAYVRNRTYGVGMVLLFLLFSSLALFSLFARRDLRPPYAMRTSQSLPATEPLVLLGTRCSCMSSGFYDFTQDNFRIGDHKGWESADFSRFHYFTPREKRCNGQRCE